MISTVFPRLIEVNDGFHDKTENLNVLSDRVSVNIDFSYDNLTIICVSYLLYNDATIK